MFVLKSEEIISSAERMQTAIHLHRFLNISMFFARELEAVCFDISCLSETCHLFYSHCVRKLMYFVSSRDDAPRQLQQLKRFRGNFVYSIFYELPPTTTTQNQKQIQKEEGLIKCPTCESFNVKFYQKQTRSADEGATTFCTCQSCKYAWKF